MAFKFALSFKFLVSLDGASITQDPLGSDVKHGTLHSILHSQQNGVELVMVPVRPSTALGTALKSTMPRDGAIIFSDLIGKLDVLRVRCDKCGRDGCYGLSRLIDKRGRNGKVIDWLDELTADCPKNVAHNMNDPCCAKCPQLPKVL